MYLTLYHGIHGSIMEFKPGNPSSKMSNRSTPADIYGSGPIKTPLFGLYNPFKDNSDDFNKYHVLKNNTYIIYMIVFVKSSAF